MTELTYTARERRFVAWSAILGYAFDFYNLIVLAFLLVPIQKSLNITLSQTGLIVGLTLAASVLGGIGFGWLGDKIGRKNALLWTLLLLALGSIASALAWDFESLLTFRIITGVGVGGEWGAGMVLLNEVWDNKKRGLGSAIVQAMSSTGTAMASIAATLALTYFDQDTAWRVALGVGGLPLLLMLFVRSKMPESRLWQEFKRRESAGELPPEKKNQATPMVEIFKGVSLRHVIVGVIITGGYIIAYQCISIFMPTLILRDLGGNLGALRAITLWFAAISAVGMIGAGYISDAYGRRVSIIVCTIIGIVGLFAIHYGSAEKFPGGYWGWTLFWAYCVWGFGQGSIGQFGPWFAELYPVEMRATATSTIFNIGRLVGASAPYVVPLLIQHGVAGSLRDAMMLGIAGAAISLFFAFFLPETVGRTFAVVEDKERIAAR